MFDLTRFRLSDMVRCASIARTLGDEAGSMEEASERLVEFFYENFQDRDSGGPACALIRLFKTHYYGELPPALQNFAAAVMPQTAPGPFMKCLTLMATRGQEPQWNDRSSSRGHAAIPLPSESVVEKAPMIARLTEQLGIPLGAILKPAPELIVDLAQKSYNIFHVEHAEGSQYVPAQEEFVEPYGVRSVIGFGGVLPSGEMFAVILFTKVRVPAETAQLFRTLALNVKLALIRFDGKDVFRDAAESGRQDESR